MLIEYLKVSKVKAFIIAESNKQHQLGKPLVKALNDFIDRTLAASVTQANHDKQSRLEIPSLINKELLDRIPISKTKPDLPFLHLTRLKERIEKLSQGKISASNQFVDKLNNLLLTALMYTIRNTPECRINKPVLVSGSQAMPAGSDKMVTTGEKTPIQRRRLPVQSVAALKTIAAVEPEPLIDKQQSQRQTKTVKIGLQLNKVSLIGSATFFTGRPFAIMEVTIRERIFKGLLDSGFDLGDLEKNIQIGVEIDEVKRSI